MQLRRFWFEFDPAEEKEPSARVLRECGVTAYSYEDAIALLEDHVFVDAGLPQISQVTEDVDVSLLDQDHIVPNMGIVSDRGVWFPLGYD